MKRLLLIASVVFALFVGRADAATVFRQPVDAPIVDEFRAPTNTYGPGNRGWEYALPSEAPVYAPAAGVVQFAGQVGGVLNVVILHDDGLRTTLSKLDAIDRAVRKGVRIEANQVVGNAKGQLFFGLRCGDTYLDPAMLFEGRIHLVADNLEPSASESSVCQPDIENSQMAWLRQASAPKDPASTAIEPAKVQLDQHKKEWLPRAGIGGLGLVAGALALRRPRTSRT